MIKYKWYFSLKFFNYVPRKNFSLNNYEILGISKTANKQEIKEAYYKLAKLYHPDLRKSNSNLNFYEIR